MEFFTLKILAVGILLGIDNFVVAVGMGELPLSKKRRNILLALFFIAEAGFPFVGLVVAEQLLAFTPIMENIEIAGLTIAALLVFITVFKSNFFNTFAIAHSNRVYFLFALPFLLALDNLSAGVAFYSSGLMVLIMGALSVVTCAMGLAVGAWARKRTFFASLKPGLLNACCLAGLALFALVGELA